MKKNKSVKKNYQFKWIMKKGKSASNKYTRVSYSKNNTKENLLRYGIAVKKTVKSSVERNRLKRLVREAFRLNEYRMKKGIDMIVFLNTNEDSFDSIKTSFEKNLEVLGLINEKNSNKTY